MSVNYFFIDFWLLFC